MYFTATNDKITVEILIYHSILMKCIKYEFLDTLGERSLPFFRNLLYFLEIGLNRENNQRLKKIKTA